MTYAGMTAGLRHDLVREILFDESGDDVVRDRRCGSGGCPWRSCRQRPGQLNVARRTGDHGGRTARDADAARGGADETAVRDRRPEAGLPYEQRHRSATAAVAIGDLSVAAGVSSTQLAQRFKELIGVTPKRLARTYRFAATVFAINPAGPIDWADLAGGAGYFDQAHFGHEFRAFTGLTPTRYVEVRRRFLREHPGHVLDGWPLPAD